MWDEIAKMAQLPEIKSVLFLCNPIYGERDWNEVAPMVVKRIPQIEQVDSKMISASIRKAAEELD